MAEKTFTEIAAEFLEATKEVSEKATEIKDTAGSIRQAGASLKEKFEESEQTIGQAGASLKAVFEESEQTIGQAGASLKEKIDASGRKIGSIFDEKISEIRATQVSVGIDADSKGSIATLQKNIKWFNRSLYGVLGVASLSIIMLLVSIYFGLSIYDKSIRSKAEVRGEVMAEIKADGKAVYKVEEVEVMRRDEKIIVEWIKKNPKASQSFIQYREGYLHR